MNGEDRFKDSLEKLLLQREFPLAEDSWEQASHLIDASRKRKKRRFFILIFSGLFLLFTGSLFFYFFSKTETGSDKKIASVQNNVRRAAPLQNEAENNNINSQALKEGSESQDKISKGASASAEKTNTVSGGINNSSAKIKNSKQSVTKFENKASMALSLNQTPKKTSKDVVVNGIGPAMGNAAVIKAVRTNDPKGDPAKEEVVIEKASVQATETVMQSANVSVKALKDTLADPTTAINTGLNPSLKDSSVAIALKRDTAALTTQELIKTPRVQTHTISAEGGIIYLAGWNYPGKKDARGYDPVIGLNYSASIFKKMIATAGINYYSVGQLSYSSKTAKITGYGFGEKSDVTIITPTRLHYLGFPLKFSYAINKNNSAGLGCNIAYLLNVTAQTETYRQNVGQTYEYKKAKEYGYTQGFKTFDVQASVFYKRRIYKELSVNAEFIYGLVDVKDNTFFSSAVFERNFGLKCTLIYNIFKK